VSLVPVLRLEADVAVIGSGFSGSLMALALRRQGRSVVMLERGRHPRFAIGESSTPLANLLIEELADRYDLPRVRPLSKWGTWQRAYPQIGCGVKRGFSFFQHGRERPFMDGPEHARQMLVAASPHDAVADLHWYRPEVDQFLAREAEAAGATLLDETALESVRFRPEGATLEGGRQGRALELRTAFVIDASGPRGFLQRALALPERPLRWLGPTHAVDGGRVGYRRPEPDRRARNSRICEQMVSGACGSRARGLRRGPRCVQPCRGTPSGHGRRGGRTRPGTGRARGRGDACTRRSRR